MNKNKLAKLISKETAKLLSEPKKLTSIGLKSSFNDYMFTECDDIVKEKSRNMIFRLLGLRDQLSISINELSVTISSEYGLKKINNQQNYLNSDYFSLEIIKDTGYIMNYKEKRLAYRDPKIYDDLIKEIKISFLQLNNDNFNELYNEVMVESGLARASNLDDLFK